MAKNLIIYYSRKGENYWAGKIADLKKGSTEQAQAAQWAKHSI